MVTPAAARQPSRLKKSARLATLPCHRVLASARVRADVPARRESPTVWRSDVPGEEYGLAFGDETLHRLGPHFSNAPPGCLSDTALWARRRPAGNPDERKAMYTERPAAGAVICVRPAAL